MASVKKVTQKSAMTAVQAAYGAASEFLRYAWDLQRIASNPEQLKSAADNRNLARCYAVAFIAWIDLHSLLTAQVRELARDARARTGEPVRVGRGVAHHSVIEAIERIGLRVRNAVYQDRSHPFEPDITKLMTQAQENTRRKRTQGSKGRAQPPLGWGAEMKRLLAKETPAVIRKRLGILTLEDAIDVVVQDWLRIKKQRFICDDLLMQSVDFESMTAQLDLEFRAIRQSIERKESSASPDPNATYVLISDVAPILKMQCGSLHRTLNRAGVPLYGSLRGKVVDIRYLIMLRPKKSKQLRKAIDQLNSLN